MDWARGGTFANGRRSSVPTPPCRCRDRLQLEAVPDGGDTMIGSSGRGRAMCLAGAVLTAATLTSVPAAQEPGADAFFEEFSAKWVRQDPDLATATRYFTGPEQEQLERQLTPRTDAWRQERVRLADEGLAELRRLDRAGMT